MTLHLVAIQVELFLVVVSIIITVYYRMRVFHCTN